MEIYATERFLRSYKKAHITLQKQAENKVLHFIECERAAPGRASHRWDQLEGVRDRVIEIDLGGAPRLLLHYEGGSLTLLDVGGHEVTEYYGRRGNLRRDLDGRREAPGQFRPGGGFSIFSRNPDGTATVKYAAELSGEWLYFLDANQEVVYSGICEGVFEALTCGRSCPPYFIIGGPGTGKTCILLKLLKDFAEMGCDVKILISEDLASYVELATGADMSAYRPGPGEIVRTDLLLVDDPSLRGLERALTYKRGGAARAVVIAFDPLQLDQTLSDSRFDDVVRRHRSRTFILDECYRQKRNVGEATKGVIDVVAASTPYFNDGKILNFRERHRKLTEICNSLKFTNPHGYVETYDGTSPGDVSCEVNRIMEKRGLMWRHWPGLLVVTARVELPTEYSKALRPLLQLGYVKSIDEDSIEAVKGQEFQHVFIFIGRRLYDELHNGFQGTGRTKYGQKRLWRIPFSRAKDSLVTFVLDEM